ncbi:hypothetical protein EDB85DRAFT_2000697 [Lactarius pseudohatsudake]|nr:hypothetical protein EDB85DRAFT_2000697 [Lactarius pseudohatsudake]
MQKYLSLSIICPAIPSHITTTLMHRRRFPLLPFPPARWAVGVAHGRHPEAAETGIPETPVVNAADSNHENGGPAPSETSTTLAHNQPPSGEAGGTLPSEVPETATHAGPSSLLGCDRKRKLSDPAIEDVERLFKRVYIACGSTEPGLNHQVYLSAMAEISNELGKTESKLFAALHEIEGLRAQICTLRAKNEQLATQLCETQRLANTLKTFVDLAVSDAV